MDTSGDVGGDGPAFIIQDQGATFTGLQGPYIPCSIPNSLAIEFDTYHNGPPGDPNGNHISIQPAGTTLDGKTVFRHDQSLGSTTAIPNLSDGSIHEARILYIPGLMRIYLNDQITPAFTASINLDHINGGSVLDESGTAWIGLAVGTDSSYENHDILSWSITPVPEPSYTLSGFVLPF